MPGAKAIIPDSHVRLVKAPPVAALTTLMRDGSPHTTPVWCNYDGVHVLVNTMRGFVSLARPPLSAPRRSGRVWLGEASGDGDDRNGREPLG